MAKSLEKLEEDIFNLKLKLSQKKFELKFQNYLQKGYKPGRSIKLYKKVRVQLKTKSGKLHFDTAILTLKVPCNAFKVKPLVSINYEFSESNYKRGFSYLDCDNSDFIFMEKIRVSQAIPIAINSYSYDTGKLRKIPTRYTVVSIRPYTYNGTPFKDGSLDYQIGKVVEPHRLINKNIFEDCGSGIHGFEELYKAIRYN